jgi:hypothetical protein
VVGQIFVRFVVVDEVEKFCFAAEELLRIHGRGGGGHGENDEESNDVAHQFCTLPSALCPLEKSAATPFGGRGVQTTTPRTHGPAEARP